MGALFLLVVLGVAEITINGINAVIDAVVHRGNGQLVGCWLNEQGTLDELQTATAQSQQVIGKVRLGDQKGTVLSILSVPENTPQSYYYYLQEGSELIEIFTLRTQVMLDGCMTDDELTPFIFRDGILVSIGWRTLSGPDSFSTPHIDNSQGDSPSAPR